jgi:hypothetical protein
VVLVVELVGCRCELRLEYPVAQNSDHRLDFGELGCGEASNSGGVLGATEVLGHGEVLDSEVLGLTEMLHHGETLIHPQEVPR